MLTNELNKLKPGDLVAWHFDLMSDKSPLVGTVKEKSDRYMIIHWGNGNMRLYTNPQILMDLSRLEFVSKYISISLSNTEQGGEHEQTSGKENMGGDTGMAQARAGTVAGERV